MQNESSVLEIIYILFIYWNTSWIKTPSPMELCISLDKIPGFFSSQASGAWIRFLCHVPQMLNQRRSCGQSLELTKAENNPLIRLNLVSKERMLFLRCFFCYQMRVGGIKKESFQLKCMQDIKEWHPPTGRINIEKQIELQHFLAFFSNPEEEHVKEKEKKKKQSIVSQEIRKARRTNIREEEYVSHFVNWTLLLLILGDILFLVGSCLTHSCIPRIAYKFLHLFEHLHYPVNILHCENCILFSTCCCTFYKRNLLLPSSSSSSDSLDGGDSCSHIFLRVFAFFYFSTACLMRKTHECFG